MGVSGQSHAPGRTLAPVKVLLVPIAKGGWVGLRDGLDTEDIGKILCL
jgi:hypothetical protein